MAASNGPLCFFPILNDTLRRADANGQPELVWPFVTHASAGILLRTVRTRLKAVFLKEQQS